MQQRGRGIRRRLHRERIAGGVCDAHVLMAFASVAPIEPSVRMHEWPMHVRRIPRIAESAHDHLALIRHAAARRVREFPQARWRHHVERAIQSCGTLREGHLVRESYTVLRVHRLSGGTASTGCPHTCDQGSRDGLSYHDKRDSPSYTRRSAVTAATDPAGTSRPAGFFHPCRCDPSRGGARAARCHGRVRRMRRRFP